MAYVIHSGVRKRHTRHLRMQSAIANRAKFVQKVGGGDILVRRSRPATVTDEKLMQHLDEIKAKAKQGLLEVRTTTGQLVDLETMKVVGPATSATKPVAHPPMDSVARDKQIGTHVRAYPEGRAHNESVEKPTLLKERMPEGEEPSPTEPAPAAMEFEPEPEPEKSHSHHHKTSSKKSRK